MVRESGLAWGWGLGLDLGLAPGVREDGEWIDKAGEHADRQADTDRGHHSSRGREQGADRWWLD